MPSPALNPAYVRLACTDCSTEHDRGKLEAVCRTCGMPLAAGYDTAQVRARLLPSDLAGRAPSLWRYTELLPVRLHDAVTLCEGWTPLVPVAERIFVKDEARNPTGSFKARGMSVAVSMAKALGAKALSAPSAGNAAGALAAYGAAAKLPVVVAMPDDTPRAFSDECRHYGAEVHLVPGTISDAGRWLKEHGPRDAFDMSTLKEPFRLEGKKTMGYELWEQFEHGLPDVVIYPTGGGTGLVGMWKAWNEMEALGWIGSARPRLVSVQAEGCQPVAAAWRERAQRTTAYPEPRTAAFGLRVPAPIGGFLCLRALRETNGTAIAVGESAIAAATRELAARSGLDICPEGGAAWAAIEPLRASGFLKPTDRVVVFNTGTGLKYR